MVDDGEHHDCEWLLTTLSIIITLEDDFTRASPLYHSDVSIEGLKARPITTPGLRYGFIDLPVGDYKINVRSAVYFPVSQAISPNPGSIIPKYPPVSINLHPRPCYPFPVGTTLIRGILRKASHPLEGAIIRGKACGHDFSSEADHDGDFVIYFRDIDEDDIVTIDGKICLLGSGTSSGDPSEIPIVIEFNDGEMTSSFTGRSLSRIEVGRTSSRAIDIT